MAKKKLVNKILDKTDLDEKIIAEYNEHKSLYNKIASYTKSYGGYLLAVGAGCTFSASFWWGLGFLAAAGVWAQLTTCKWCKLCNAGGCSNE